MIVRPYYLDMLKTYRDVPLVKILAGIRRCGKSTILDMLKDDLFGNGIAADHVIHLRYTSEDLDERSSKFPSATMGNPPMRIYSFKSSFGVRPLSFLNSRYSAKDSVKTGMEI